MAEVLLRRLLEDAGIPAEVRSAGTLPWTGGPAQPEACATVADAGLDLSRHEAQALTNGLVAWADVILGMQRAHVLQVRELDSTADVRLITEFDPERRGGEGIEDPIGQDREVYGRVFGEIRRSLDGFVASRVHTSTSS